jgi:hypothetical protein
MSFTYIVMIVISAFITPLFVLLIPHARQSPVFSRVLWAGTFVMAFLGAWLALGYAGAPLDTITFDNVPWVSILLGAVAGALLLHLLLWGLDLLEHPPEEDEDETETPA